MVTTTELSLEKARAVLETVMDPEVPVLSVMDLGVVRDISINKDEVLVTITPTYTGCPAIDMMSACIKMELLAAGFRRVTVMQTLSPAWTTDWMTEKGKQQLKEYGIAPPHASQSVCHPALFASEETIQCPHCNSWHTHRISEFGSTACKSLYQCDDCKEPFDYFKCH